MRGQTASTVQLPCPRTFSPTVSVLPAPCSRQLVLFTLELEDTEAQGGAVHSQGHVATVLTSARVA